MLTGTDNLKPIYVRLADWLETEILNGNLQSDERIYSQYQLADMFNINPATAAKSLNILADRGLLYKKRGLGMFVASGAGEAIRRKRVDHYIKKLALELVTEAERLDLSEDQIIEIIKKARVQAKKEESL